jgi:DMSO/TMAO reductase YedYZ heme-binding membrane subunit
MNPHTWWYLARATGYVAWALLTASVISGLLVRTRLTTGRRATAWALDLHRFLAGTAVAFTGLHIVGLVADGFVHFGPADVLIPFASTWRPGAVALGVTALYLLLAIEASSVLMRRLPRRLWHRIHLTAYVAFWLATFHLLYAGTDTRNPASKVVVATAIGAVGSFTVLRAVRTPLRGRPQAAPSATPVPRTTAAPAAPRQRSTDALPG